MSEGKEENKGERSEHRFPLSVSVGLKWEISSVRTKWRMALARGARLQQSRRRGTDGPLMQFPSFHRSARLTPMLALHIQSGEEGEWGPHIVGKEGVHRFSNKMGVLGARVVYHSTLPPPRRLYVRRIRGTLKGASRYDVRKIFGFFDLLPPFVRILI